VYNVAVVESPRDEFPNNFVGDLVPTERGWVVVPPTCCPAGEPWEKPPDVGYTREKLDELNANAVVDGKTVEGMRNAELQIMRRTSGLTEERLAARLGISRDRLAEVSFRRWHMPFSQRRDLIAGNDANKQQRGQVTRALQAQLEEELADGNG
jgi:hypothetical protein